MICWRSKIGAAVDSSVKETQHYISLTPDRRPESGVAGRLFRENQIPLYFVREEPLYG
jgi:hypothetical protein